MNEIQKIEDRVDPLKFEAQALVVKDNESYLAASEMLKTIKQLKKEISSTFDPIIKKQYEAHKEAVSKKRGFTDPLDRAERAIKPKIGKYLDEQERIRLAEIRKKEAEAKKKIEDEQIAEAAKAEEAGESELANEILDEEIQTPIPTADTEKPEFKGQSKRKVWKWEVKDPQMIKRKFLIPNKTMIGAVVRGMGKEAQEEIGGIQVTQETNISVKTDKY